MKILVLADNFLPEIAATSFRVRDHAKVWIEQGHEVTVVTCAPNWPHGKLFPGYRNRLYQEEWIEGIRVIRVWSYMAANGGFLRRSLDFLSYMMSAIAWSWRFPDFDVVLATSPQFFTAVAGRAVSALRRRPWVFEVRDLWPESIKAVGAGHGRIIRWLERLELSLYRRANRVITVTNAFKENLTARGIAEEKIDVVTNGVDLERFHPGRAANGVRKRLGVADDAFLTGYVGTTGMAHGLETVLTAAAQCADDPRIQFLIVGEGARRTKLEARARSLRLTNLRFHDRVRQEEMPGLLAAFDLPIIHLKPEPLFKTVIPSKLFECMAMARPVLMAVEGEAARVVTDAGCGTCIRSGDPQAMAAAIRRLAAQGDVLAQMGRLGREAAARHYSRRVKAESALRTLESAVNGNSSPGTPTGSPSRQKTVRKLLTKRAAAL